MPLKIIFPWGWEWGWGWAGGKQTNIKRCFWQVDSLPMKVYFILKFVSLFFRLAFPDF